MDQTSVIFKDQDAISSYKPPKGTGVVELSKAAGIGVPDAFAVQLPAKVSKYVLGSVSVGKSGVRYNISPSCKTIQSSSFAFMLAKYSL
jgi:hypothetical protein